MSAQYHMLLKEDFDFTSQKANKNIMLCSRHQLYDPDSSLGVIKMPSLVPDYQEPV